MEGDAQSAREEEEGRLFVRRTLQRALRPSVAASARAGRKTQCKARVLDRIAHPQVLQRRVEPFTILAQALLAVVNVPVDLDDLSLKHVPVRLQAGEHVDEITLRVLLRAVSTRAGGRGEAGGEPERGRRVQGNDHFFEGLGWADRPDGPGPAGLACKSELKFINWPAPVQFSQL